MSAVSAALGARPSGQVTAGSAVVAGRRGMAVQAVPAVTAVTPTSAAAAVLRATVAPAGWAAPAASAE
ncbi:hypothetical protein [Mycobacterium intermedium]|uniref:hypothetical protein n=1 Tax=Mycobacterium intermedium TaxID=28445 RepID=UPI001476389E|nr:hypothetical protein [Mycobacterium intermedium]